MEIVRFELNNWNAGTDYPMAEPFLTWMEDDCDIKFMNDKWVEDNKLCVSTNMVDMSFSFRISAPLEWVKNKCPELLTKYKNFIVHPDEDGIYRDKFGYSFSKYAVGINYVTFY